LPGTDKDGLEQNNIQAGIGLQPNKNISIKTYFRFNKLNGEIDQGAFLDELDYTFVQKSYQAGIRNEFIIGKANLNVLYNYNHIDRLYIDDSVKSRNGFDIYSRGFYTGAEHFSDVYVTIPAGNNSKITAGADFRSSRSDQEYFSEGFFGPFTSMYANDSLKQNQAGVYAAININARSGFNIELGNRINIHSVYGANYVFNVNPSYLLNKKLKLFANLSNAYRTPSLYQLFSEYGNKNLRPESAITAEAGAQYFFPNNKITARTVFFKRNVKDVIFFYFNPANFRSQYINQDRQNDYGGEFEAAVIAGRNTTLKVFYSYVNGKITTKQNGKDTTFFNLLRRPKHSLGFNLSSQITNRFYMGANLLAFGKRNDAYFDAQSFQTVNVILNSYMLLDVYLEYNLYRNRIKLFIDFRNLTNSKFTEVSGFNTIGFNVFSGLRLNL
jgi:vitamin B12 transporter